MADVGVVELGQIRDDVIVKVHFDDREFRFVGETSRGSVIPVPAVGRYDRLVVEDLRPIDDDCAGGFDEVDNDGECGELLSVGVDPEGVSRNAERRVRERRLVR